MPGADIHRSYADKADMIAKYFNTAAFVPPSQVPPGTYGNSGRNILTVPATYVTNFSALKDFRLKEPFTVQFRSEFFNLLQPRQPWLHQHHGRLQRSRQQRDLGHFRPDPDRRFRARDPVRFEDCIW